MYNTAFGIIIILIFVSLVVLFCALLIKYFIHRERNHAQELYQKDIDFQKEMNATIIETQEHVLNNIALELHDDAGQQLTYINFQIENLKLDTPSLIAPLNAISESISNLSRSIRSLSHSMNNQILAQQDVLQAIAAEVERLKKNQLITIDLTIEGDVLKRFTEPEKIIIYRIFQEIINNIFKHAKATKVTIHIKNSPKFEMTITDDGKGFDSDVLKQNHYSLGLLGMQNRAAVIDYHLEINSGCGKGTTILLSEKD